MRAKQIAILLLLLTTLTAFGFAVQANAASRPAFVVIINRGNPSSSLDRRFVEEAFLKKTTRWESGEVIRPVDQSPDASVRHKFSEEVLKRSVAAVRSYWQQMIFTGRDVPPPELDSDDDVVKYVAHHTGAIGYVSGDANIGAVKTVNVR